MKKIGVLTYYWSDNPGTFLQAYATVNALRKNIAADHLELVGLRDTPRKMNIHRGSLYILPFIREVQRSVRYRDVRRRYLPLSPEPCCTRDMERAKEYLIRQRYDLIIVGADTVWQLRDYHRGTSQIPIYWLPPDIQAKKIACATSSGALCYNQMTVQQQQSCANSISRFELIGVRDHATENLLGQLGVPADRIQRVPDPTFSMKIDYAHAEEYIKRKKLDFSRPTLCLNVLRSFKYAALVADHFRSKGFQIVTLTPIPDGDLCLRDINPLEWAGLHKYFTLVITDRFHGTVFSLKNLTPVVSVVCEKRKVSGTGESKILSLLRSFGMEQSNYAEVIGNMEVGDFLKKCESAISHFDSKHVRAKLTNLSHNYNSFIKKMNLLGP